MSSNSLNFIPDDYTPVFTTIEAAKAIKLIKDTYERNLAEELNLTRVSAPIIVPSDTGINDLLNGVERPVEFDVKDTGKNVQIVQSLAKWKRLALKRYGFKPDEGLYTDMNAIRRDESLDALHSVYVDQWDWERIITQEERNVEFLKDIVKKILNALRKTEKTLHEAFPEKKLPKAVPEDIFFLTTQELEDKYPNETPKKREELICKEHPAVFLMQIGKKLKSGIVHDGRSPDYDDWELNGDILLWYEPLKMAYEISSMGIWVNKESLLSQLKIANAENRKELMFHKMLLNDELPLTLGGGIGQSRLCMYLMKTIHIAEVQASVWPEEMVERYKKRGVVFL